MAEDSFEKARKAFFRTVTTTPKSSVSPAEFLKPPNKATQYQSHRSLARQSLASFAESWNRTSMRVSTSTALSIESGCALSLAGLANSRHSLKVRAFSLDGFSFSTGL
jgi:hypothetical protein